MKQQYCPNRTKGRQFLYNTDTHPILLQLTLSLYHRRLKHAARAAVRGSNAARQHQEIFIFLKKYSYFKRNMNFS